MTNEELYLIMQPIVQTVTGLTNVILADPNAESPLGEYCVIRPKQSITQRGQANIIKTTGVAPATANWDVRPQIICEMSLEFFRGEAMSYAELMMQANKRIDISEALYKAVPQPIGWQRAGNAINLTALQSDNWEQRAQISIYVMYELISTGNDINVESIEKVPFEILDAEGDEIASGEVVTPDAP
jgi:hypothetical protein